MKTRTRLRTKHAFSAQQKRALRLARRGDLVRCRRGYKVRGGNGERVATATVWALIARGWLVVATTDADGTPVVVQMVGSQIEMPFSPVAQTVWQRGHAAA